MAVVALVMQGAKISALTLMCQDVLPSVPEEFISFVGMWLLIHAGIKVNLY